MKKLIVGAVAGLGGALVGLADLTTFPDSAGTHDISTAESWNGVAPSADLAALFRTGGVFTASQDFTCKSLNVYYAPAAKGISTDYVFDMTQGLAADACRTVTVVGTSGNVIGFYSVSGTVGTQYSPTIGLKGGYWHIGGGSTDSAYIPLTGTCVTLSDGAVVTNIGGVCVMTYSQHKRQLRLRGKSRLYANADVQIGSNSAEDGVVSVTEGSELHYGLVKGSLETDGNGSARTRVNTLVEVAGRGSLLKGSGRLAISSGKTASRLVVTNEAQVEVGSLLLMTEENRALIENSSLWSKGAVTLGDSSGFSSSGVTTYWTGCNVLSASGSVVRVDGTLTVGNYNPNNVAVFTNSTVAFSKLVVGANARATNNIVRFAGPATTVTNTTTSSAAFFGTGRNNVVEFCDGAKFTPGIALGFGTTSTNNEVRLLNGASIDSPSKEITVWSNWASRSNTLYVGASSSLTAWQFRMAARWCGLTVSNGLVKSVRPKPASGANWTMDGLQIGYNRTAGQDYGTNNVVVLQGTRPQIVSAYELCICNSSKIRFELPPEGFDADIIPMTGGKIDIKYPIELSADVDAYCEAGSPSRSFPVIKATEGPYVQTSGVTLQMVLDEANAAAEKAEKAAGHPRSRYSFYAKNGCIYLKVRPFRGTCIIVR